MRSKMSQSVSSAAPTTSWVACPTAPLVPERVRRSIHPMGARMSRRCSFIALSLLISSGFGASRFTERRVPSR